MIEQFRMMGEAANGEWLLGIVWCFIYTVVGFGCAGALWAMGCAVVRGMRSESVNARMEERNRAARLELEEDRRRTAERLDAIVGTMEIGAPADAMGAAGTCDCGTGVPGIEARRIEMGDGTYFENGQWYSDLLYRPHIHNRPPIRGAARG